MDARHGARAFPRRGLWGLGAIAAGAGVSFAGAAWAPSAASLLCWWGLAVALDAAAFRLRGESVLEDAPDAFVWMAVLSIFMGVGVEWSAGRLAAWSYLGLPFQEFLRYGVQGAALAAFLPALHGAGALLGSSSVSAPRPAAVPKWGPPLGLLVGGACMAVPLAAPDLLPGLMGLSLALFGLWAFCDSLNALRDRPNLLAARRRRLAAWGLAGLALVGAAALITMLSGQGRFPTGFESPSLYDYLLLVCLGPALRAAYLLLADVLGLPAWPPREDSPALLR